MLRRRWSSARRCTMLSSSSYVYVGTSAAGWRCQRAVHAAGTKTWRFGPEGLVTLFTYQTADILTIALHGETALVTPRRDGRKGHRQRLVARREHPTPLQVQMIHKVFLGIIDIGLYQGLSFPDVH